MIGDRSKRVLVVLDCGLRWPTGMVRALQFKSLFDRSSRWRAHFVSRHPESIIKLLYGQHTVQHRILVRAFRPILNLLYNKLSIRQDRRIVALAQGFDLVSIVKSPSLSLYQRLRRLRRPRVLMDINDALWLQKNGDWAELDAMLREVDAVICENNYLSNYATRFNPRTFVIDDAPQLEVFDRWRAKIRRSPEEIVVGWIGGQSNIGPLFKILEPLEALSIRYPQLRLRVVGAPESALPPFERVRASCLPTYSQEQMVREILKFDIGLFPLFHNEDGRARGTLKAKVYMSGEAVAVCENYGENPGLIEDGYNGFLATSPQDWYERLDWLITHPSERATIAERGLQVMRRSYTAERVFQRLLDAFDQTLTV